MRGKQNKKLSSFFLTNSQLNTAPTITSAAARMPDRTHWYNGAANCLNWCFLGNIGPLWEKTMVMASQSVKSRIQVCNYFIAGSGPESTSWHFGSLLPLSITIHRYGFLLSKDELSGAPFSTHCLVRSRSAVGEGRKAGKEPKRWRNVHVWSEAFCFAIFHGAVVSFSCWPSTKVFTGKAVRHNGFFWLFNNQITPPLSTPQLKLTSHSLPCAASSCLDSYAWACESPQILFNSYFNIYLKVKTEVIIYISLLQVQSNYHIRQS